MSIPSWPSLIGATVDGQYTLRRLIGAGETGVVYVAAPSGSSMLQIAVKLMEAEEGEVYHKLQLHQAAAALSHPSLIRHYTPGAFKLNGTRLLYLPAELADESLAIRTRELDIAATCEAAIAVATALVYLHSQAQPRVHGGVKPSNILRVGGRWKLGDLSHIVAVNLRAGGLTHAYAGPPDYAPPESYDGLVAPAWDIWSLGVVLHEATSGRHPFGSTATAAEMRRLVCTAEPEIASEIPAELRELIQACLERDPALRTTAEQALESLEALSARITEPVSTHRTAGSDRLPGDRSESQAGGSISRTQIEHEPLPIADGPLMDNIVVSKSGEGDFSTITEAISRAADGASITVRQGTYREIVVLDRRVTLTGEGNLGDAQIDAVGQEAMAISAQGCCIRNLTLLSRAEMQRPRHHGVAIHADGVVIEECDISCNSGAAVAVLPDAQNVVLRSCTIHEGKSAGIVFEPNTSGRLEHCALVSNFGPAVHIKSSQAIELISCDVYGGRESGILVDPKANCVLQSCSVYNNGAAGIIVHGSAVITGSAIYDNSHAGIAARAHSNVRLIDCDLCGNALGGAQFSASEVTLLRCRLHDGKSNGLAATENSACVLEECEISGNAYAGVKLSHGARMRAVRCKFYGGKRNAIVLQAESSAEIENCEIHENGQPIQIEQGASADLLECSFLDCTEGGIQHSGTGTITRCRFERCGKSAIECTHGASPTIRDCTLESNKMPAILVHGKCEAFIEGCRIERNEMPGIAVGDAAKALITGSCVCECDQVGMVFYNRAKGIVDRSEVSGCKMDGVRVIQEAEPIITNCRICNNAHYGLHVSGNSGGEITDCDLSANGFGPAYVEEGCGTTSAGNTI